MSGAGHFQTMLSGPPQSHSSLGALGTCLVGVALTGCADSGAIGDESASTVASISGITSGGGIGSSSLTASTIVTASSVTVTNSVTSSSGGALGDTGTGGLMGSGGSPGGGSSEGSLSTSSGGIAGAGGMTSAGGATASMTGAGGAAGGGAGGTSSDCPPATPMMGGQEYCSNSKGNVGNGYGYELWAEGTGSGCMTIRGVDATFGATWSNVEDFLARVGLDFDQTRTHTQIGTISAEFAETKTDDGGLTYIGVYGWTVDPLLEFYILDDWGATKPGGTASDGTPRTHVGTITVDGATYEVWKKLRENKPAITGPSETFEQFFSIRETARQCGRISVSEHFEQWEDLGVSLGKLHEAKLLLEAQGNSGSIEFTTATVVIE